MNVQKIIQQLKKKYPNKAIIQNKNDNGVVTEILCEIEPASVHPEWSSAVAVLDESAKHYHNDTTETYKVLNGTLNLFVDGEKIILNEGETYTIQPQKVHYATGNETWFECRSKPGWRFEDYILEEKKILGIIEEIVELGVNSIKKNLNETDLPIDYVAIFAQSETEFNSLTEIIENMGNKVEETSTGFTYKLKEPIKTVAGMLSLVKVRKYDPEKQYRGAPDFRVKDYKEFKKKHLKKKNVNLIDRKDYEMLELVEKDVLVYFPNKPLSLELGINKL